ncbi:MAG: hypothetical protein ACM31K_08410 [Solirubrobacterales bacterium]
MPAAEEITLSLPELELADERLPGLALVRERPVREAPDFRLFAPPPLRD